MCYFVYCHKDSRPNAAGELCVSTLYVVVCGHGTGWPGGAASYAAGDLQQVSCVVRLKIQAATDRHARRL
jgi:hypothetical protein